MRFHVLYYFISSHHFQIGAPAVAGIGAAPVPSRRTRLSTMPVLFGYTFYDKTEIDSESCEVTVISAVFSLRVPCLWLVKLKRGGLCVGSA